MDRIIPRKSLGQNFLIDRNIAAKIVESFAPTEDEAVVEIGPGEGALTGLLTARGCRPTVIEIDPRAAERIREEFGDRVRVLQEDVLQVNLRKLHADMGKERLRVIGNIPYYITSPILFHLFEAREVISDALLMMQREVAERLTALPRTKEYGILAVATQTYSQPKRLFNVGPRCFRPPPKVTSTVVHLAFRDTEGIAGVENAHRQLLRAAFNQRRKTLRNSLASVIPIQEERETIFQKSEINPSRRAEELSTEDFIRLARVFADARQTQSGRQDP